MAKKAKATHPVTSGRPKPSQKSRPKPAPESVVKAMTEGAGCMSEPFQRAIEPAEKALGLFGDGGEQRGQNIDIVKRVAWARRQILVHGLVALLGHQIHTAALSDKLADLAVGIAQVAEMPRVRWACAHADRHAVLLGQVVVVDAVDAKGAFLHHPLGLIHLARAVGAGPGAEAAADAVGLINQNDAVLDAFVAGPRGADGDAGRVLAMQAGFGEMHELRRRVRHGRGRQRLHLVAVHAVEEGAGGIGTVRVLIAERCAVILGVPALARDHAGMTADTGVEVNDEAEFAGRAFGKRGHAGRSSIMWVRLLTGSSRVLSHVAMNQMNEPTPKATKARMASNVRVLPLIF